MDFKKFGVIMCILGLLVCGFSLVKQSSLKSQQEKLRFDAQLESLEQTRGAMDAVMNGRRYDRTTPLSEQKADALDKDISDLNTWLIIGGFIFVLGGALALSANNKPQAA